MTGDGPCALIRVPHVVRAPQDRTARWACELQVLGFWPPDLVARLVGGRRFLSCRRCLFTCPRIGCLKNTPHFYYVFRKVLLNLSVRALIPCRKQDKRIGGMNSPFYFSLIYCEYIYTKANLTFLIDYNSIRQVSQLYM